jgi:hypothetical protein
MPLLRMLWFESREALPSMYYFMLLGDDLQQFYFVTFMAFYAPNLESNSDLQYESETKQLLRFMA